MRKPNYFDRKKWDFLLYIHDYLFLAGLFPFFACVCMTSPEVRRRITMTSLLLILPILFSQLCLQWVKSLTVYVVIGVLTGAAVAWAGMKMGATEQGLWLPPILLALATFALFGSGVRAKTAFGDAKREYQATHPGQGMDAFYLTEWDMETVFNNPRRFHWEFMGLLYLAGVVLRYHSFLRIQFCLLVADIVLVSIYRYILGMRTYLHDNRMLRHMPLQAMMRTHRVVGAIAGAILLLCILPSILYGREFIPTYHEVTEYEYVEPEYAFFPPAAGSDEEMLEWLQEFDEKKEPPWWLNPLFYLVSYTCLALFIILVIVQTLRRIRETGRNFAVEDEDEVVLLEEEKVENENVISSLMPSMRHEKEGRKVRRRYKKAIKKATKGTPVSWGSPTELEREAGLVDEDMRELHDLYEEARYGWEE